MLEEEQGSCPGLCA